TRPTAVFIDWSVALRSTATLSPVPIAHAPTREIVRAHFNFDPISQEDSNAEPAHAAARVGQELVPVFQSDRELGVRKRVDYGPIHFDSIILRQCILSFRRPSGGSATNQIEHQQFRVITRRVQWLCVGAAAQTATTRGAIGGPDVPGQWSQTTP